MDGKRTNDQTIAPPGGRSRVAGPGSDRRRGSEDLEIYNQLSAILETIGSSSTQEPKWSKIEIISLLMGYLCRDWKCPLKTVIGIIEKNVIWDTLQRVHGNQRNAAHILGLKFTTLNVKIKKYGIRIRKHLCLEVSSDDPLIDPSDLLAASSDPPRPQGAARNPERAEIPPNRQRRVL